MTGKIVGFYDSRNTAEKVENDLVNAGFSRSDVHVFSGTDGGSFWDDVKSFFGFADESDRELYGEAARRGSVAVSVDLSDTNSETRALQILERYKPIDLDRSAAEWRQQGWSGHAAAATTATASRASAAATTNRATAQTSGTAAGSTVIPVVEEELRVGKRQVRTGGIRVYSKVTEKPIEEQVQLRQEHVSVQRRPTDRPVTDADRAFSERTIEATETAEQAVVSKEARVVEEVTLNKNVEQTTQTVRDKVRRSDVAVEQIAGDAHARSATFAPDQFVAELASDQRYRGRDWTTLEPDVRKTFEQRYPGNKWDQVKDTIRQGYDKVRQKV